MSLHDSIPIIDGFFNLTYVRNTGAAFGIFAGSHEVFRRPFLILVSVIASVLIVITQTAGGTRKAGLITALTFILGGAIGNLIDRVLYGEVIDFLDVYWPNYHWPAFNVADSFITVGVTITLYYLIEHEATILLLPLKICFLESPRWRPSCRLRAARREKTRRWQCFSSSARMILRCTPLPLPWIRRTSRKPACLH